MKLHDTRSGELLSGAVASGATVDDLDKALPGAVQTLLEPLSPRAKAGSTIAVSAHLVAGYGWTSGDGALVSVPLLSTGATGSARAVSFGGGLDLDYKLTPLFVLGVFGEDAAVATDTFVNMFVFGAHARIQATPAFSLAAGAGWARMAASVSGPAGLVEIDYRIAGPLALHAQALYAHSSNSDGLFAGQNSVLSLGAGVSVFY